VDEAVGASRRRWQVQGGDGRGSASGATQPNAINPGGGTTFSGFSRGRPTVSLRGKLTTIMAPPRSHLFKNRPPADRRDFRPRGLDRGLREAFQVPGASSSSRRGPRSAFNNPEFEGIVQSVGNEALGPKYLDGESEDSKTRDH